MEQSPINVQNAANPTAAHVPPRNTERRTHTRRSPLDVHSVGKPSYAKASLHGHLRTQQERAYTGTQCQKAFSWPTSSLRKHAWMHIEEKPLHMSAVWESLLGTHKPLRHMRTHSGEQRWTPGLWERLRFLQTWNASSTLEQNLGMGRMGRPSVLHLAPYHPNLRAPGNLLMDINMVFLPKCLVFDKDPRVFIHVLVHVANLNT